MSTSEASASGTNARAEVAFDAAQRAVIDADAGVSGTVLGAPGTGKTEVLLARAVALLESGALAPGELVVLAPTRQAATRLRDRLSLALTLPTPGPIARSAQAFAFQLVRERAAALGQTPPRLLPAGEQDAVLAELIEGDVELEPSGDGGAEPDAGWPETLALHVRRSREFRAELRTVIALCAEEGVGAEELEALAAAHGVPAWASVARLLRDYRFALQLAGRAERDPAELLAEAAAIVGERGDGLAAGVRAIFVDDAQELTRGGLELLRACRERGIAVLAFGDPDVASGAFRGASPELFGELVAALGGRFVLRASHRSAPEVTQLVRTLTQAIGASGPVEHRVAPEHGDAGAADAAGADAAGEPAPRHVRSLIARSGLEEADAIARTLRAWHLREGIPWHRLAVIAHDTRQVAQLDAELSAREVPTRAASLPRPIGDEPAARALLRIVELGLTHPGASGAEPGLPPSPAWPADALADALVSPFGGLDGLGVRRLRARLRLAEIAGGGARGSAALMVACLADPLAALAPDGPEGRAAARLAGIVHRVHREAQAGASVHELLWRVWEGAGREAAWTKHAAAGGALAADAERALDAVVALFDQAKRFAERFPDGGPRRAASFVRDILSRDVPDDRLPSPARTPAVALLTPAAALGLEFDAIVIAGVQEGVWPNTRPRGGLLDSTRLAAEVRARREGVPVPPADAAAVRRALLSEEMRLFVRALSRTRGEVLITAVEDEGEQRSRLFRLLPVPEKPEASASTHPLTLRGLVSKHRRTLTTSTDAEARRAAAAQLALLARAGVPGAHPDEWFGVLPPSSTAPLRDPVREPVRVSPSKLESFERCGLDWALRALGGDTRTFSAGIGTILHEAMELAPTGSKETIMRVLDERFGELDFEAPWLAAQERAWAETLAARLHIYLGRADSEGAQVAGAEARFRLAVEVGEAEGSPRCWVIAPDAAPEDVVPAGVPIAIVSGSIDRVEVYPPGGGEELPVPDPDAQAPASQGASRVVVVDLKTGRAESRVSGDKVENDAQLSAYQLAVIEGAITDEHGAPLRAENAGARLVVLSKTLKGTHYRIAHQPPLDAAGRDAFLQRVVDDARGMAAVSFTAHPETHCTVDTHALCGPHLVGAVSAG